MISKKYAEILDAHDILLAPPPPRPSIHHCSYLPCLDVDDVDAGLAGIGDIKDHVLDGQVLRVNRPG